MSFRTTFALGPSPSGRPSVRSRMETARLSETLNFDMLSGVVRMLHTPVDVQIPGYRRISAATGGPAGPNLPSDLTQ